MLMSINQYLVHTIIVFFFFNDTATTEIYTLSLHDALPILPASQRLSAASPSTPCAGSVVLVKNTVTPRRSEEHTSELQSRLHLVCRLLLEKKKQTLNDTPIRYI